MTLNHVLVVGASRGLGRELVRAWLARGAHVTALVRTFSEWESSARRDSLTVLAADVASEAELAHAAERCGPLDVLVYNAAIHLEQDRRDIEAASSDDVLRTLDINAVGAMRAVKHFRRHLRAGGRLVFISSEAGSIHDAKRTSELGYCMSKAALNMLGKLLANREAARGSQVDVVCVHPGWVRTDMGGPNAHLSVEEAAAAPLTTLDRRASSGGPLYIDRLGAPIAF